jgi:hypothetical protein
MDDCGRNVLSGEPHDSCHGGLQNSIKSSRTEESYDPWDQDVVDELLLARADAVAWKSALDRGEISFSSNDSNKKFTHEYDELDSLEGSSDGKLKARRN